MTLKLGVIFKLSHVTDTPNVIWIEIYYYVAAQNERPRMKGQMSTNYCLIKFTQRASIMTLASTVIENQLFKILPYYIH